jgi:hypothetical protein
MALNGVGGSDAGSALERFQAIRDSAKKKIEGADGQSSLAELIKRKQLQLGTVPGAAARNPAERIPSGSASAAPAPNKAAAALFGAGSPGQGPGGVTGYGRSGGSQKQDTKPTLGRHVDFMA